MQKILLIGNGPSATSMKLGKEIDEFDGLVARFNTYRIKGFEEYVGTRTDIWITCEIFPAWQKDYKEVLIVCYARKRDTRILDALRKRYPDCDNIPEWAWDFTVKTMGFSNVSSGAVAVGYFQRDHETYIYGFDFFSGSKHHYGDEEANCHHITELEMEYFRKLIVDGKVIPFHDYLSDLNYEILHRIYPGYGVGGNWFRNKITEIAKENNVKTILDYGCGKGGLVKLLSKDYEAYGYDPYVEEFSLLPITKPDMVVSTDFLEHVEEKEIDQTIAYLEMLQPKVQFHAISNRKASQILPDGKNAHRIVKPAEWWEKRLSQLGTVTVLEHNDTQNFTMYTIKEKGNG